MKHESPNSDENYKLYSVPVSPNKAINDIHAFIVVAEPVTELRTNSLSK